MKDVVRLRRYAAQNKNKQKTGKCIENWRKTQSEDVVRPSSWIRPWSDVFYGEWILQRIMRVYILHIKWDCSMPIWYNRLFIPIWDYRKIMYFRDSIQYEYIQNTSGVHIYYAHQKLSVYTVHPVGWYCHLSKSHCAMTTTHRTSHSSDGILYSQRYVVPIDLLIYIYLFTNNAALASRTFSVTWCDIFQSFSQTIETWQMQNGAAQRSKKERVGKIHCWGQSNTVNNRSLRAS